MSPEPPFAPFLVALAVRTFGRRVGRVVGRVAPLARRLRPRDVPGRTRGPDESTRPRFGGRQRRATDTKRAWMRGPSDAVTRVASRAARAFRRRRGWPATTRRDIHPRPTRARLRLLREASASRGSEGVLGVASPAFLRARDRVAPVCGRARHSREVVRFEARGDAVQGVSWKVDDDDASVWVVDALARLGLDAPRATRALDARALERRLERRAPLGGRTAHAARRTRSAASACAAVSTPDERRAASKADSYMAAAVALSDARKHVSSTIASSSAARA